VYTFSLSATSDRNIATFYIKLLLFAFVIALFGILFGFVYFFFSTRARFVIGVWAVKFVRKKNKLKRIELKLWLCNWPLGC
jgi:hypothetical protein